MNRKKTAAGGDPRLIVHCGVSEDRRGGIRTVMGQLQDPRFHEGFESTIVATASKTGRVMTFLRGYRECARLLRSGRVACLHIHMSANASAWRSAALIRLARHHGSAAVLHSHGGELERFHKRSSSLPWGLRDRLFAQLAKADRIVALTPGWRDWWLGVAPEARVEVVPNFVEVPPADGCGTPGRDVLFLGELSGRKRVYDIVKAAPAVLRGHPGTRFRFGGAGDVDGCLALARELGVEGSCDFCGWVGPEEKARLLGSCGVLVLPSEYESFGIVLLEAMSYGRPVVCSDGGRMSEVVDDGIDGVVFPAGDVEALAAAIGALLDDPARAREMGARGRATVVERYSSDALAGRWSDLYRSVAR